MPVLNTSLNSRTLQHLCIYQNTVGSNVFKSSFSVSAHLRFHDIFQTSCISEADCRKLPCYSMHHVVIKKRPERPNDFAVLFLLWICSCFLIELRFSWQIWFLMKLGSWYWRVITSFKGGSCCRIFLLFRFWNLEQNLKKIQTIWIEKLQKSTMNITITTFMNLAT